MREPSSEPRNRIPYAGRLVWVSLAGLVVTVPHVTEDFVYGVPQKFGLGIPLAGLLLGTGYFVQFYGLVLLLRGRAAGLWVSLAVGVGWFSGAVWEHLFDLFTVPYREGIISKLWIVGLIVWSALLVSICTFALYAMRRKTAT